MSLEVLNRQRKVRVDLRRLKARLEAAMASAGVGDAEVDLVLVSDRAIRVLNRRWRGKDRPTDCLSFPSGEGAGGRRVGPHDRGPADPIEERHLGDIVISAERALAQAQVRRLPRTEPSEAGASASAAPAPGPKGRGGRASDGTSDGRGKADSRAGVAAPCRARIGDAAIVHGPRRRIPARAVNLDHGVGLARPGTPTQRALEDEVVHLFVHSLLHLLGHDHETDAEARRMRAVERRVLRGTVAPASPTPARPARR